MEQINPHLGNKLEVKGQGDKVNLFLLICAIWAYNLTTKYGLGVLETRVWSRDVLRPYFQSIGLEAQSLDLRLENLSFHCSVGVRW